MDQEEGSSVTAAVVNVVCELGWRRPRDFLPLAPRLFDLLVEGGNNWMAIKIIKLFSILTPLEPRLIKKLLPPLTQLIRTTPAMSLLYECINGIIQGGVLEGTEGAREGDEIALLCVQKLRGMIVIDGDPNLKYVALLAFKRILLSHPELVSTQQDVIMSCIDDQDISIRLQALELGVGMVTSDTLVVFVERLIQQLQVTPPSNGIVDDQRQQTMELEPAADSDGEDPEEALRTSSGPSGSIQNLPTDYRVNVIQQILLMCSKETYANITDFEWYIEILIKLVRLVPTASADSTEEVGSDTSGVTDVQGNLSGQIGSELRNVAVRVSSVRSDVVLACNGLLKASRGSGLIRTRSVVGTGVLQYAAWVVGEYVANYSNPYEMLDSLLISKANLLPLEAICAYLQAVPKIFAYIVSRPSLTWDAEKRTAISLLISRIVDFLEPLSTHPNLEVQERSVEYLELMRLASQAIPNASEDSDQVPLLLARVIPDLFKGFELNPVAPSAQLKVPMPPGLDLDVPINPNLQTILHSVEQTAQSEPISTEFDAFYNERQAPKAVSGPAIDSIPSIAVAQSYQQGADTLSYQGESFRRRTERREKNKDDPFYIGDEASSGTSTPFHEILQASNGEVVDVDSIPIMSLDLGEKLSARGQFDKDAKPRGRTRPKKVHVAKDETFDLGSDSQDVSRAESAARSTSRPQPPRDRVKKSLLEVDSSNLGSISLEESSGRGTETSGDIVRQQEDEMARALAEVERLRLEMQRDSERVSASDGAPSEGTLVKKKKKKKARAPQLGSVDEQVEGVPEQEVQASGTGTGTGTVVKKKKKKKKSTKGPDTSMTADYDDEALYQL